jgi:hypothetical protein
VTAPDMPPRLILLADVDHMEDSVERKKVRMCVFVCECVLMGVRLGGFKLTKHTCVSIHTHIYTRIPIMHLFTPHTLIGEAPIGEDRQVCGQSRRQGIRGVLEKCVGGLFRTCSQPQTSTHGMVLCRVVVWDCVVWYRVVGRCCAV